MDIPTLEKLMDTLFDKDCPTPFEILRDAAGELPTPMDWGQWLRYAGYLRTLGFAMRKAVSMDGKQNRLEDLLHKRYADQCRILGAPPVLLEVLVETRMPNGLVFPRWRDPNTIAAMTLLELLTNNRSCCKDGDPACDCILADKAFLKPLHDELFNERYGNVKFRIRAHREAATRFEHEVDMVLLPIPPKETHHVAGEFDGSATDGAAGKAGPHGGQ